MRKGQIIGNLIILAFFIFMLLDSLKLREVRRFGEMGSGFWPILILAMAIVLTAFLILSSFRKSKKGEEKEAPQEPPSPEEAAGRKRARKTVVLCSAATLAYIFAMQWIGFALATLLYVLSFILVLGERRKWVLLVSPVLVTVLILLVFSMFIAIPFPKGIGFFADFSRLLF